MSILQSITLLPQPRLNLRAVIEVASVHNVAPVQRRDLPSMRDLAERLMDHKVASLATYRAVQSVQPCSLLVYKEEGRVTGVIGMLFLRAAAVEQLVAGEFDALDPALELLTAEDEAPVAAYAWGVAAETKDAGKAILGGGAAVRQKLFPTITAFTRAVTGAGRHVAVTRYGYRSLRFDGDDLMVREPAQAAEVAA
ncbi:MAG TPA: hypothetical protein VG939_21720 [Caulobacteraceae bacterium]|nr:hypothetical protein [Caulobacteraceae bacterium]